MCKQAAMHQDSWVALVAVMDKSSTTREVVCVRWVIITSINSLSTHVGKQRPAYPKKLKYSNSFEQQMFACLQPWLVFALHHKHFAEGTISGRGAETSSATLSNKLYLPLLHHCSHLPHQHLHHLTYASVSGVSSLGGACRYMHTSQAACQGCQGRICAQKATWCNEVLRITQPDLC